MHGPVSGTPKAVELFVINDIPDLSIYGIGCANNGLGSNGEEFSFPSGAALAGDFIYVVNDGPSFLSFFGFNANFVDGGTACNFNGNDAIELFENAVVIDTFGEISNPGDGTAWEYTLGWAHRLNETGPDGNSFFVGSWEFSALNEYNGTTQNNQASSPYPIGAYAFIIIEGCTNASAQNYNANATVDDGSCIILGCFYAAATNFNPEATVNDGSCQFPEPCNADVNNDAVINTGDLTFLLSSFGQACPVDPEFAFLQEGTGSFIYSDYQPLSDRPITVHYHIPAGNISTMPIVFVFHGNNRNGAEYRDAWIASANSYGVIVIAPEFSEEFYPGSAYYMEGNIRDSFDNINPESEWTFSIIDPLFNFVKTDIGNNSLKYEMFGHSAGAQFVHRFITFTSSNSANRAVSSNAGWYTVPDPSVDFPYGLNDSPVGLAELPEIFSRKLIVHLGQNDTDSNDPILNQTPGAVAQGPHRYSRGLYFYAQSLSISGINAIPSQWSKIEVPGVGHDFELMSIDAASILFE